MTAPTLSPIRSPFARLTDLLGTTPPGEPPLILSVGEPRHAVPDFVAPILAAHISDFNKYPAVRGTDGFRRAISQWTSKRYPGSALDPARDILVLNGSREGLFSATLAAAHWSKLTGRDLVLMPNPYYPPYAASARAAGARTVLMDASAASGFLPDLSTFDDKIYKKTLAMFLCSPANPQGVVASAAYLDHALALARQHGFLLFVDECYSEIYDEIPPPGVLEAAARAGSLKNLVVFNSLSKRSNLAGLRIGFCAGDAEFIDHLAEFRNVTCPQVPLPVQAVAEAAYGDEHHVIENRALYRAKFAMAERVLGNHFGKVSPGGGFFIWLDVSRFGGDESIALTLWREAGLRVVPGSYLASTVADGHNPGAGYLRLALVEHLDPAEAALRRLVACLNKMSTLGDQANG